MNFTESKEFTLEELKEDIEMGNITFITQQETLEKESLTISSSVWLYFRRMLHTESNKLVENYAWCTNCHQIQPYYGSTTTRLLDHSKRCPNRPIVDADEPAKINFKLCELEPIREAAANFIVKDCQPFSAIDGDGLHDLCFESVKLGWKYPNLIKWPPMEKIG